MNQQNFPDNIIPLDVLGPGSQPDADDGLELTVPTLPKEMYTYVPPSLPEDDAASRYPRVIESLNRVIELLNDAARHEAGEKHEEFFVDVSHLNTQERDLLNQVLGEGEVSIRLDDTGRAWQIQESVFTGVWRVIQPDSGIDVIDIGPVPSMLAVHCMTGVKEKMPMPVIPNNDAVINAPSILVELAEFQAKYRAGGDPHVINLSLLPHTPEDLEHIDTTLGAGRVTILSRGYGNCRVSATGVANVWWVQYFNSMDSLILNTLEIVDVPEVVLAAPEDLTESVERLQEILEVL